MLVFANNKHIVCSDLCVSIRFVEELLVAEFIGTMLMIILIITVRMKFILRLSRIVFGMIARRQVYRREQSERRW